MDINNLKGLMEAYQQVNAPIDEGKSSRPRYSGPERVDLGPEGSERRTEKRSTHAEYRRGHTEGPGTVTKNPKKLRKQKAMGELGGSGKAEVEEGYLDIFDVVLEFLQAEGYAETLEEAEWMMANLIDEEAIGIILGEEQFDEALTGERYKTALKKGKMYSRMVSKDPSKRATRGGRGGESDFGAGDRGAGNKAARRAGTYKEYDVNEASSRDEFTRAAIARNSGRKGGITFEPGPNWDPSANRGKGAHLSPKQKEKQRRKALRQEEFELWVNELVEEGYDLSDYTWDEMYDIYEAEKPFPYEKVKSKQVALRDKGSAGLDRRMKMGAAVRRAKEAEKTGGSQRDAGKGWYHAKEDYVNEAQAARNNPEKYEREQAKKSAPVRGERTPMPPRGDKRREEFEKWYAKQMGR